MSPQTEIMIQNPFHHSHGNNSISQGGGPSSGANPRPSPNQGAGHPQGGYPPSQGENQAQGGRSKQGDQQQQNSPQNPHGNQMYMQPPHPMSNAPPYMGHAPHMQHSQYPMQQQQPSQNMSSPHHALQGGPHHHGYPMHPQNMYHPTYSQPPYHPQMHPGHGPHGAYPPHPYAMQQPRSGSGNTPTKMGNKDFNDSDGMYSNKSQIATAVSKKGAKDSFSAPFIAPDTDLTVEPMKSDFFFFLQEMREEVMAMAKKQLKESCITSLEGLEGDMEKLNMKNDEPHPYLLFSNMNERLIHQWEEMPQDKRSEYLVKEEEDRKRFMTAEEVASRHCATLTARARSPQPFTPKNRDKGKANEEKKTDKDGKSNGSASPSSSSVNRMLESESEKSDLEARSKSVKSKSSTSLDESESPTKKSKTDPLLHIKKLYGDFMYVAEKHDNLSKQELLDLAEKVPKEASPESSNAESDLELFKTEREKFLNAAKKDSKSSEGSNLDTKETLNEKKETKPYEFLDEVDEDCDDNQEAMVIESLLDRRIRQVRGKRVKEYLVRWKGFGEESDSWEPFKNVEHCGNCCTFANHIIIFETIHIQSYK